MSGRGTLCPPYLCPDGVDSLWVGVVPRARPMVSYSSAGAVRLQPVYQLYQHSYVSTNIVPETDIFLRMVCMFLLKGPTLLVGQIHDLVNKA